MRQRRYIAPWQAQNTPDLDELSKGSLAALKGRAAIYHVVSRVVNREFIFGDEEKEHFVKLMRQYERFSKVNVLSFCVMSNHFHILLEVPQRPENVQEEWSDERFLEHLSGLYSGKMMGEIRQKLTQFRSAGLDQAADEYREKFLARMWDLSAFMKVLKQRFTQWYNRRAVRKGVLWEDRFQSSLIEDGRAAQTISAYIDLNPVRAGMVEDPKDYRWSNYAEAVAGNKRSRAAIQRVMFESQRNDTKRDLLILDDVVEWRRVAKQYRLTLFETGAERSSDSFKNRKGISKSKVQQVRAEKGKLTIAKSLQQRVRHFTEGLVIGSKEFVDGSFFLSREYFGENRKDGARKIKSFSKGVKSTGKKDLSAPPDVVSSGLESLCSMRDLQ